MNVLFFISSLQFGGAEKQTVSDANMLVDNHTVYLCCYDPGFISQTLHKDVILLKIPHAAYFRVALNIIRICKTYRIDVIHSSLYNPMIISSIAGLFLKTAVVWHFHSHEYELSYLAKKSLVLCSKFPSVKKFVCVSNELRIDLIDRFSLPSAKTVIAFNSSNISFSGNLPSKVKSNTIILGYVGRLVELKRVSLFIDLALYLIEKEIFDFEILIIGDGPEFQTIKERIIENSLSDKIKLLGFQLVTQSFYQQFDLFILPSREECLSISLIEAGMMGVPAIAFNVGGNNEIIEDETSGFIANDIDAFFNKCYILIADQKLRSEFSQAAQTICTDRFSQSKRKEILIQISESVI